MLEFLIVALAASSAQGFPDTKVCLDGSVLLAEDPCPALSETRWTAYFDAKSDEIRPRARMVLDDMIKNYRAAQLGVTIVVIGHTDKSVAEDDAVSLSQRMAANVKSYLLAQGIPQEVIVTEAYGSSRPFKSTASRKEQKNRRVEIRLELPGSGYSSNK